MPTVKLLRPNRLHRQGAALAARPAGACEFPGGAHLCQRPNGSRSPGLSDTRGRRGRQPAGDRARAALAADSRDEADARGRCRRLAGRWAAEPLRARGDGGLAGERRAPQQAPARHRRGAPYPGAGCGPSRPAEGGEAAPPGGDAQGQAGGQACPRDARPGRSRNPPRRRMPIRLRRGDPGSRPGQADPDEPTVEV